MGKEIGLRMGALSPKLASQLADQGLVFASKNMGYHLQRDADEITRLRVRHILTPAEARKCEQRLMKRILESVVERTK